MKTIVVLRNKGDKGKTETLRAFANIIISTYPELKEITPIPINVPTEHDFKLVVEINGKIIGIESQGDPNSGLREKLELLANKDQCDLILCSTRTKRDTVRAVNEIAQKYNYDKIWTSTYEIANKNNEQLVNTLKGKHILELIQQLGLI